MSQRTTYKRYVKESLPDKPESCEVCLGTSPRLKTPHGSNTIQQKFFRGFMVCNFCYANLQRLKGWEEPELRVIALYYKLIANRIKQPELIGGSPYRWKQQSMLEYQLTNKNLKIN